MKQLLFLQPNSFRFRYQNKQRTSTALRKLFIRAGLRLSVIHGRNAEFTFETMTE